MSSHMLNISPQIYAYLQKVSLREAAVLTALRQETMKLSGSAMQISPEQGQFMSLLVELMGAKRTLDIGTFTGYSALSVALSLPADGKVIACDVDEKTAQIARQFWQRAGVDYKIELHIAKALDTLDSLLQAGQAGSFDFAFIDADKLNYNLYYERALSLVRSSGLVLLDNVLWGGAPADENEQDKTTNMFRALNLKLLKDERVTLSMLPIGDGLTLARKREHV